MSVRTSTSVYRIGHRHMKMTQMFFERRCPFSGQVVEQREMARNLELHGFTQLEERNVVKAISRNDFEAVERMFKGEPMGRVRIVKPEGV